MANAVVSSHNFDRYQPLSELEPIPTTFSSINVALAELARMKKGCLA